MHVKEREGETKKTTTSNTAKGKEEERKKGSAINLSGFSQRPSKNLKNSICDAKELGLSLL